MSRPRRNSALAAAGVLAAGAASGWLTARRAEQESARRRANDPGRTLEVRGAAGDRLHVRVHGPDSGPTLILLHGWTETMELWHKQVKELAGELRIVTYDHRGHGLSEPASDRDYSFSALAADLGAVLDATAPEGETVLLAGHSMGAMTIAAWSDRDPQRACERASGAALISTGLDSLTREHVVVRQLPGPFETVRGRIADGVLESPLPIRGVPVSLVRLGAAYAAMGEAATPEDIDLTARMALDCDTRARSGCGRSMARMDLIHAVDDLEIPTIVVAGGQDRMTPISHAERIETALPNSLGLRVDPDAGHITPLEAPELVNDALRELAAAVREGSAESSLAA